MQRLKDNEAKVSELDSSVLLLKSLSGGGSGVDGDSSKGLLDALEVMVDNLRKECYAKFADRDEQS